MKVLICFPKCSDKEKDKYDKVMDLESFLNVNEIMKDPFGYLKTVRHTMLILQKQKETDLNNVKELLYKIINRDFLDLVFNSQKNEDVELHVCLPKNPIQGAFTELMIDIIKDISGNVIIEKEC
jgi:uncharacterized protein YcgL (UPF0745 family)